MRFGKTELILKRGDITQEHVDAIVNAANSGLLGGGGVDGAIHRAGGPAILEECKKIRQKQGTCPPGQAVLTGAGKLNAKYVIHTVGPVWNGGSREEAETLSNCYLNSLVLAASRGAKTIAFPSIGTGAYRYPIDEAAQIGLKTCVNYASSNDTFSEIKFILFSERDLDAYENALEIIVQQHNN